MYRENFFGGGNGGGKKELKRAELNRQRYSFKEKIIRLSTKNPNLDTICGMENLSLNLQHELFAPDDSVYGGNLTGLIVNSKIEYASRFTPNVLNSQNADLIGQTANLNVWLNPKGLQVIKIHKDKYYQWSRGMWEHKGYREGDLYFSESLNIGALIAMADYTTEQLVNIAANYEPDNANYNVLIAAGHMTHAVGQELLSLAENGKPLNFRQVKTLISEPLRFINLRVESI